MIRYFRHNGLILFDDLLYQESASPPSESWRAISDSPGFEISDAGNARHSASGFFLPRRRVLGHSFYRICGRLRREDVMLKQAFPELAASQADRQYVPDVEDYISEYPVIEADKSGAFVQWHRSIDDYIRKRPNDGLDRYVLYRLCAGQYDKVYGIRLRWDYLFELKHRLKEVRKKIKQSENADYVS
jgi:hypothetical protein